MAGVEGRRVGWVGGQPEESSKLGSKPRSCGKLGLLWQQRRSTASLPHSAVHVRGGWFWQLWLFLPGVCLPASLESRCRIVLHSRQLLAALVALAGMAGLWITSVASANLAAVLADRGGNEL